jgi:rhodanese-related sulfurtransferase
MKETKSCYLLLFASLVFGLIIQCDKPKKVITVVDYQFMEALPPSTPQLLDVRTENEYQQGHIEGAINIDFRQDGLLEAYALEMDKTLPVYLYCYGGGRSKRASQLLDSLGFSEIYDYSGGYSDWSQRVLKNP